MLYCYRRFWALPAAFMLALPLIVCVVAPAGKTVSTNEARVLAPAPSLPDSLTEWRNVPRKTDAYLRDHFGLRQAFLHAYALIMNQDLIRTGTSLVLNGSNGWMFYRGNAMVQQSAGLLRRDQGVAEVADLLATMQIALAARGTRLLVASPPNSATIYMDQLPLWAQNRGQRTEYDVFLDELAARGIQAVDLRVAMRSAQAEGKIYRMHDTHWTARGAVAAFNAIVQADSHPDWKLDTASVLGPPAMIAGGDLARMLGIAADVTEPDQALALPAGERESFAPEPFATYLATSDRSGPTIMIIGDSYTEALLPSMLLQHTGRVVWLHHQFCRFDWKWIEQFHPNEVWWMPTERYIFCRHGDRPVGLPRIAAER
jgi:alginate O-acetyltransferase complex protein AlgJ